MNIAALFMLWELSIGGFACGNRVLEYRGMAIGQEFGGEKYADLGARLEWGGLIYVGGNARINSRVGGYALSPTSGSFGLGAGITWRCLELGWRHECTHPIGEYEDGDHPLLVTRFYSGSDEIFFRISGRSNILGP